MISISDALILTSLLCIIVTVYGTLQQPTQYLLRPEMTVSSELETFTVDNERLCGARCEVLEACESYSVVDDESGEYTCILHDKNGLDRPASVTGLENSTLYDLYKPGDSVQKFLDGCRDVICENDGKCLTDPTDVMSYKCACHGSYHGPHCEIKYDEEPVIMQEIPIRAGFNVVHFRFHGYDHLVYSSVDCGETITIYRRLETDADADFVMWHTIPAFICSQMIEVLEIGGATYILSSGAGGVFDSQMNEITDGGPVPVSNTQWAVSMNAPHTSKSIQSTVIDNDILLTISQHGSVAAKTVRISGESPTLVDSIELPGVTCETPALFEADNDIYQILYCNPVDSIASRVYKLTGTNTWELHQELGNNGRQWYTYEQRGRRYVLSSGMHSGSSCELPDNIALYLWDPYLKVLVKKNAITSPCVSWLKIFTLGDETMIIATRERESLDLSFTTDPITTIVYKIDGYRIEKQAELNGAATKRADGFLGVDGVYLALTHNQGRDAGDETAATITVYKWV